MERKLSMPELKEKIASLELKRKESEFFLQQEFDSLVDSYSPAGILNAVLENNKVSGKKWLILALGIGLSALLRKYFFRKPKETETNFFQGLIDWLRESNDDLIDKGIDYIKDWVKGYKK